MSYAVRPVGADEVSLVCSSYVRGIWERGNRGPITYSESCKLGHERIELLLASEPIALCVVDPEAPGWCGGWAIGHTLADGALAVHWVYVKGDYRRYGLAALLVRAMLSSSPEHNGKVVTTAHVHRRLAGLVARKNVRVVPLSQALARKQAAA